MNITCVYHSRDLDGWCSAAIVRDYYKEEDISLIGWDYGMPIPNIEAADKLIICDVSFNPDYMLRLLDLYGDAMVWLDHHKSAIDRYKDKTSREPKGIRNMEYAACELTWFYFHPKEEMPLLVKYLGMYDSFRHRGTKEETKTLQIQYGARMQFTCPEDFDDYFRVYNESPALLSYFTVDIQDAGEKILEYVTEMAKESIKRGFGISIKGKRFLTVNENRLNPSKFGIDYHKMGYDGFASFWYRPDIDGWEFSLYSDDKKTDVSIIAKEMGGGGHFGAAGFTLNNIEDFIIDHKINNPF